MLKRIFLALGYIGLTLLVIVITVGLVAYGSGYAYSFNSGKLIRTGLLIVETRPSGLPVTLNGKKLNKKTPYRTSQQAGTYRIDLSKDGYYPWSKVLEAIPSEVTLAQYVTLIPKNAATTTRDSRAQIVAQAASPDHRLLAYVTGGPEPAVYTLALDDNQSKPTKIYTAKAVVLGEPAEQIAGVSWSSDASHVLVGSQLGATAVHHLVTIGATTEPINLTTQYGFNFSGIQFSPSNWQQLYWLSPDGLRRLDVNAQSVSGVLADKVSQFKVTQERILYVQTTSLGRSLYSMDRSGRKTDAPLVAALPESPSYSLDATRYNSEDHIAVVPSATGIGTIYSGVDGPNPVATTIAHNVATASFSPDGHLLAFQSPASLRMYDLERSGVDRKTISYDFPAGPNVSGFTWFDDFHVLLSRSGRLVWSEFDGANQVDLGAAVDALAGYSSPDLRTIYRFDTQDDAVRIRQAIIRP